MIDMLPDDNTIRNSLDRRVNELASVQDAIELLADHKEMITSLVLSFKYTDREIGPGAVLLTYSGDKDVCYGLAKRLSVATEDEMFMEDFE